MHELIQLKSVSNTAMHPSADIEKRLTELEIKASFSEDLLDQLNQVIVRQQEDIALLTREVIQLRRQIPEVGSAPQRVADEPPPHY
jgi:SlyX protein